MQTTLRPKRVARSMRRVMIVMIVSYLVETKFL